MALAQLQSASNWWAGSMSRPGGLGRRQGHPMHCLPAPMPRHCPFESGTRETCQNPSSSLPKSGRREFRSRRPTNAVASEQSFQQTDDEDIAAGRNPYLEGDFVIGEDEEWEEVPLHRVKIHDTKNERTFEVDVPEDRYILHTAEEQGHVLPFACRMGCCTSCAVRVKSGKLYQPLALGISNELKAQGYALMCVAYPLSDVEIETQDEDEVYYLQFGRYFARGPIERDDIALEIALQDE